ncbi:Bifunctional pantoate ligase/cytidylate kinase [Bienertia sinuspersici]
MKGTKAKVIGQLRVVPDYEKKRSETLKKNAQFMKSKGHGTLANKILQERAETSLKYAENEDEDEYSRENEGDQLHCKRETVELTSIHNQNIP